REITKGGPPLQEMLPGHHIARHRRDAGPAPPPPAPVRSSSDGLSPASPIDRRMRLGRGLHRDLKLMSRQCAVCATNRQLSLTNSRSSSRVISTSRERRSPSGQRGGPTGGWKICCTPCTMIGPSSAMLLHTAL